MTGFATQSALAALQSAPIATPQKTSNVAAAEKVAKQFEGIFIAQMLSPLFNSIPTDGPMGGGPGEAMFRSLMVDRYGQQIANSGGFGLSDAIVHSLLQHQTVNG